MLPSSQVTFGWFSSVAAAALEYSPIVSFLFVMSVMDAVVLCPGSHGT